MSQPHPFEDYLKDKFWENYHGTDDDSVDAFETWISNLDIEELLAYGDKVMQDLIEQHNEN